MSIRSTSKLGAAALIFSTPVAVCAQAGPATSSDLMQAYNRYLRAEEFLIAADDARDNNRWKDAGADYERALVLFSAFAVDYPHWQPQVVQFRIRYSREQAEAMSKRLARSTQVNAGTSAEQDTVSRSAHPPTADSISADTAPNAPSFAEIARRALLAGQFNRARDLLLRALRDSPDDHHLRLLIGTVQCATGQYEDAYYILSALAEERPNCAFTRNALAAVFMGLGHLPQAVEQLQRALAADGSLPDPHVNMAYVLLLSNNIEEAARHYRLSLTLGGDVRPDLEERIAGVQDSRE